MGVDPIGGGGGRGVLCTVKIAGKNSPDVCHEFIGEEKFFNVLRRIHMPLHQISTIFPHFFYSVRSVPRSVSPSLLFSSDKQF